ncbi:MAG: ferrochelatase, partial [Romboutsia sp.]|uniref:ferrochelatase n=1 Tax=Romboutsia sp. TaxID=1965302 RepID=UPI003F3E4210
VNFILISVFRDHVNLEDISPQEEREETVVLLISEGESKNYNLKERATQIYYDKGIKSYLSVSKDLYEYQDYYNEIGSSDFKEKTEQVASRLREKLDNNYKVVNSYLYSAPYFENSLEDIISKGYKNIILCPMFMTEGREYEIFKQRFDDLNLSTYNLSRVEILDTFYKSNKLATLYKDEIMKNIDKNKDVGVLMIGMQNKNNLEQDILFREKIQEYIESEEKNNDIQIKLPLLENNKKDIIKAGESLLEYGIDELYVVIPTYIIDTIYTKHLAQSIFKELDMGNTKFYYIDPINKIDVIVDELFTRISLVNQIGG